VRRISVHRGATAAIIPSNNEWRPFPGEAAFAAPNLIKTRRLRSVTSSASFCGGGRHVQRRTSAFGAPGRRRGDASISDASTVLTAVQLEPSWPLAARDRCDRPRPLRRHRMFCVKYATITRRLFRPRRIQSICLCLIVKSSQDDSGWGGNARDPRWARKAGDGKCGGPSKQS
jgi:hypothetical protein